MELSVYGKSSAGEIQQLAKEKEQAIKQVIQLGKVLKRKIIFATTARFLVGRAKRTYGLSYIEPYWLPNPINLPRFDDEISYSIKPSLCFLGRLDMVKRPWVVFELAKRFPSVDFYIGGETHFPDLMNPIIRRYSNLQNLKFLGFISGEKKEQLLKDCWGIINTSIHEAEPVSFLEALSYGKPIISCQDPDGMVSNYGYYTGECLGMGDDEETIYKFSEAIESFLKNAEARQGKGLNGRREVFRNHSFENFTRILSYILKYECL